MSFYRAWCNTISGVPFFVLAFQQDRVDSRFLQNRLLLSDFSCLDFFSLLRIIKYNTIAYVCQGVLEIFFYLTGYRVTKFIGNKNKYPKTIDKHKRFYYNVFDNFRNILYNFWKENR